MTERDAILSCCNLGFSYDDSRVLLEDVSAQFETGSFNQIRGASGSGKSTFLRLLNRLEQPRSGNILYREKPLESYPPPQLRRAIAYIQQSPTLLEGTVQENLLLPFRFSVNKDLVPPGADRLIESLREFGLGGVNLSDHAPTLSGGQKQRLCLLRSLLLDPQVLLLDEPVSALDPESKESVEAVIVQLNRQRHITVLLASHQPFSSCDVFTHIFEIREHGLFEASCV